MHPNGEGIDGLRGRLIEVARQCSSCHLSARRRSLPGWIRNREARGRPTVIGQNPGQVVLKGSSDIRGAFLIPYYAAIAEPGGSSRIMWRVFNELGLTSRHIYSTNLVKCPTKGNAFPTEAAVTNCSKILLMEFRIEQPSGLLVFGKRTAEELERVLQGTEFENIKRVSLPHPYTVARKFTRWDDYLRQFESALEEVG